MDQLRMKRALEEMGRRELEAKEEAEALLLRARSSVEASQRFGADVGDSSSILEQAEREMGSRDYRKALSTVRRAMKAVESESQSDLAERYAHLRGLLHLEMVSDPPELVSMIEKGESAISVSIPLAVEISESLHPAIRSHLIEARPRLYEKVRYILPDSLDDERLSGPLDEMMREDGEAESLHSAMSAVIKAVRAIILERREWLQAYSDRISRFIEGTDHMDLIWKDMSAHLKMGDYETVKKEMDLVHDGLDSHLEMGLPMAFERARARMGALNAHGVPTDDEAEGIALAEKRLEIEPLLSLDDYEETMGLIIDKESDLIASMIQDTRDMIAVGRHIGMDLSDVIIGLDEVRSHLLQGELDPAVSGVETVKQLLHERMGGYEEMEAAYFSLSSLLEEASDLDLDLEKPMELVERARDNMPELGLEASLALVREAIGIINHRARERLGAAMVLAQMSLQAGFRIDADVREESGRLGELFEMVDGGRYLGVEPEVEESRRRIRAILAAHARQHLESFLREIDERDGIYDVKKMRLQARGAEKLLNEGSPDESYRIIWTARRQLSNLDVDALEENLKKVRDLVSTGEAVDVDVSDLKRIMFSFRYDGGELDLGTISQAAELTARAQERIEQSLRRGLQEAHVSAYQAKMAGYQTDEQLGTLRRGFRLLDAKEYRSAYGALKEAEIGFSIQALVHDEVYDRLLRISRIVEQEGLDERPMRRILDIFHEGRYRDADVETKKLLRSLIEKGLRSAANDIMEEGEDLIATADMLNLKVLSLRESMPQARFFLENEDYRNASSLIEKAMRTGRSETSRALQSRASQVRARIGEPMLNRREKAVSMDMLGNTRINIESGRYGMAASILLHLEEDLSVREGLVDRCRLAQAEAREQLGVARMLGLDIAPLQGLAGRAESLLREGKPILSLEASERLMDRIGELMSFRVIDSQMRIRAEGEAEGLTGPDLDRTLSRTDDLLEALRQRRFHYAKEALLFMEIRLEGIRIRREALAAARAEIESVREALEGEGMGSVMADEALLQLDSHVSKGEFSTGALGIFKARLDLLTALGVHKEMAGRLARLRDAAGEMPPAWECGSGLGSAFEAFEEELRGPDVEEAMRSFLTVEGELPMEGESRRAEVREAIREAGRLVCEETEPAPGWSDEELQAAWEGIGGRLRESVARRAEEVDAALASSRLPNLLARTHLDEARGLLEADRLFEADRELTLASMALGRSDEAGREAIEWHGRMEAMVADLAELGHDVESWQCFLSRPPAHRVGVDRRMSIMSRETSLAETLRPEIEAEQEDGELLVRNLGPGIARDIRVGDETIPYLGIGQSQPVPLTGAGDLELSYLPLTGSRRLSMVVKVEAEQES